ncbi:hypothetical protein [Oscillatoria sp. FACHB-1406]|uniref:hypothetical protein n=1 Tax=Oscillatoria sp. FACHB-1406 TaxID=2692846 RepID=UPI001688E9C4|nr:hypothetical protein [Oscillatoria sp. FACHB-1406]MBD2580128.1 hypothetical protein [Oscillatoria sp. FACHB-1406]
MSYIERLHPWCIVRFLPNLRHIIVARFRRRNDAIAHLDVLQRLIPNATLTVVFEPPSASRSLSLDGNGKADL